MVLLTAIGFPCKERKERRGRETPKLGGREERRLLERSRRVRRERAIN